MFKINKRQKIVEKSKQKMKQVLKQPIPESNIKVSIVT